MQDTFIVNTYGYGDYHDAKQMKQIAENHNGKYYYIEKIQEVTKWFVLSISGLLSAVGKDLKIKIKLKNRDLSSLTISQLYGGEQLWVKHIKQEEEAEIYLPHLIIGDDKLFAFDLAFDHKKFKLNSSTSNLLVIEAQLEVNVVSQESIIRVSRNFYFEYKSIEDKEIQDNKQKDYYEELKMTKQRAIGGMKIQQATNLINQKKDYDQAKEVLQQYKEDLSELNQLKQNDGIIHLNQDIKNAIENCLPESFKQALFQKMEATHCLRSQSISHKEDWNADQKELMEQLQKKLIYLSDNSGSGSAIGRGRSRSRGDSGGHDDDGNNSSRIRSPINQQNRRKQNMFDSHHSHSD